MVLFRLDVRKPHQCSGWVRSVARFGLLIGHCELRLELILCSVWSLDFLCICLLVLACFISNLLFITEDEDCWT